MRTTIRKSVVAMAAAGALAVTAAPASADHVHYLVTPGTCVQDVAQGQTSKAADEPGGHVFHDKVHVRSGSNGVSHAELTDGRVTVYKAADFEAGGSAEHLRARCGLAPLDG